ncbi:MAG: TonB-dependent receptor [Ignavibacteriaceae bacterium]|nr:TonB-dependent receptor [Ignavibacteriaceae bacterium]
MLKNYQIDISLQRQLEGSNIIGAKQNTIEVAEKINTLTGGLGIIFNSVTSNHVFTYGAESYYDVISSSRDTLDHQNSISIEGVSPFPAKSRYLTSALFAQDQYENDLFIIIGGLRYSHFNFSALPEMTVRNISIDEINASSSGFCGSLNVALKVVKNRLNIYGGISQGFRAPNANDLSAVGLVSNFGVEIPNSKLRSEKSINYEAGVKGNFSNVNFRVSTYYMRLYDYITREASGIEDGTNLFKKVNSAEGELSGVNFSVSVHPFYNFTINSAASYTIGNNLSEGEPLSKIPPFRGGLSFDYNYSDYWLNSTVEFSFSQKRISSNDKADSRIGNTGTPGYTVWDVRGGFRFSEWGSMVLGVENILNQLYKVHGSGIYSTGRSFIVSLNIDFK